MAEQSLATNAVRRVLTAGKNDIGAGGVGQCVDGPRRCRRSRIRVNTDVAEVVAKAWLHESASSWFEWLAHAVNWRKSIRQRVIFSGRRRAHHFLGHVVRFALVFIIELARIELLALDGV